MNAFTQPFAPPSTAQPPFGMPADVVLDIPVPPSVNRTRRIDRSALRKVHGWEGAADSALMASGQYREAKANAPAAAFRLAIILDEKQCRLDPDNIIKHAVDYLRRLELIRDDSPKYFRGLRVYWGHAPAGCRLILRGAE